MSPTNVFARLPQELWDKVLEFAGLGMDNSLLAVCRQSRTVALRHLEHQRELFVGSLLSGSLERCLKKISGSVFSISQLLKETGLRRIKSEIAVRLALEKRNNHRDIQKRPIQQLLHYRITGYVTYHETSMSAILFGSTRNLNRAVQAINNDFVVKNMERLSGWIPAPKLLVRFTLHESRDITTTHSPLSATDTPPSDANTPLGRYDLPSASIADFNQMKYFPIAVLSPGSSRVALNAQYHVFNLKERLAMLESDVAGSSLSSLAGELTELRKVLERVEDLVQDQLS